MMPTLHNFDLGVGIKTTIKDIQRFDIIIIKVDNKLIIKRVFGLPGEHIKCDGNKISINGFGIEDDYASGWTSDFDCTLGDNEYFCLGDNRENSSDSRSYGPFTIDEIKAVSIYN